MGTLQLGPMIIKVEWIIFLISAFAIYFVLRYWLKDDKEFRVKYIDTLFNVAFIGVATYKFSIVLFKPSLVFQYPSSILFYTGGTKGMILGVILAVAYLVWKMRRKNWKTSVVLTGILYVFLTFITSFWLLRTLYYIVF